MKAPLTLYILPSRGALDHKGIVRAVRSFGDVVGPYIATKSSNVGKILQQTVWYGYLYDSEWIDDKLAVALLTHLESIDYADFLVLYKKVKIKGEFKFFTAPRIFKAGVALQEEKLIPQDITLPYESLLDGWIMEDARN